MDRRGPWAETAAFRSSQTDSGDRANIDARMLRTPLGDLIKTRGETGHSVAAQAFKIMVKMRSAAPGT